MTKSAAATAAIAVKNADEGAGTGAGQSTDKGAIAPATPGAAETAETVAAPPSEVVVFGLDPAGKAHASRFGAADAALATRAAALMRFMVLPVTTADHAAAASELPVGRVFASGRGFVPFCKAAAYDRLRAFAEAYAPEPPADAAGGGDGAAKLAAAITTPATWGDIAAGALVLASEGEGQGWFEAVITEDRGEDLFVLRWRDWPDAETFPRRREHLALLPAAIVAVISVDAAPAAAAAAA